MEDGTYYKLCGGTFFTLLLQARKQRTVIRGRYENKPDSLSEPNVFAGLIKVAKPGYIEPEKQKTELKEQEGKKLKKITSDFKNCKGAKKFESVPFMLPPIIEIFDKRIRNEYKAVLNDMQEFTNNFIDMGIGIWLVERLLDLVESDKSIKDAELFYLCQNGQPMSKAELCDLSKIGLDVYLSSFLLGIWHFIICNKPDNIEGRHTIISWHEKNEVAGRLGKYIGPKKSNIKRKIKIIGLAEAGEGTDTTTDTVLQNNDRLTHKIINDLDNEIDTQVVETSQIQTPSDQMKKKFKEAIEKYNIAEFMNSGELAPLPRFFDFVNEIKSKVLYLSVGSQKEWMYEKIRDFTLNLESYNGILAMVRPSYSEFFDLINTNEALLNDFEKRVVPLRHLVNSLYGEICDGETLYVY